MVKGDLFIDIEDNKVFKVQWILEYLQFFVHKKLSNRDNIKHFDFALFEDPVYWLTVWIGRVCFQT